MPWFWKSQGIHLRLVSQVTVMCQDKDAGAGYVQILILTFASSVDLSKSHNLSESPLPYL